MLDVAVGLVGVAGFALFAVTLAYVGLVMLEEPADGVRDRDPGTVASACVVLLVAAGCACVAAWMASEVGYLSGLW